MFKLGDNVRVSKVMHPIKDGRDRIWVTHDSFVRRERRGIVCGVRTVKEGHTEVDYEYGATFVPTKHIKVYLVATDLGQIIRALPEDLELIADGQV